MDWILWAIIIALVAFIIYTKKQPPKAAAESIEQSEETKPTKKAIDYGKCYQRKYLLTKNEYYECKKLIQYATAADLIVCPKVRLLDILEPKRGEEHYKTLFYKVQAKHLDFVICDKSLHVLGAIELDDNSHDLKSRKDRDSFVDQVMKGVGYTIVHTRGITENTLNAFKPAVIAQGSAARASESE